MDAQIDPLDVSHAHLTILATPMSCWPKHFRPVQFPDLISLYYAAVEGKALRVCHSNVEALKANANKVWANMSMVNMAMICLALRQRLEKCLEMEGSTIK